MSDVNTESNHNTTKAKKRKKNGVTYKGLIRWTIIIFFILIAIGVAGILSDDACTSCAIYKAIGFGVIMIWSCIFICYFIWASYFYNINYGITDEEWEKIDKAKEKRSSGGFHHTDDIDDEPQYNPYNDQTFGLPPGTVRGMIAFTLLFGAISLLIVSFGMKDEISPGNFFRDQFEFFKTAFLMMVAFYFGSRSLKYLRPEQNIPPTNTRRDVKEGRFDKLFQGGSSPGSAGEPPAPSGSGPTGSAPSPVVVIDSSDPLGEKRTKGEKIPPIVAIDPMAKK